MNVWLVEDCPPHEASMLVGIYDSEAKAQAAKAAYRYQDHVQIEEVEVQ